LQYADDIILSMENDLEQATNMKLLLCAFERWVLKLISIKVNYFVMVKQSKGKTYIPNYLGVILDIILSDILGFQCITRK
jgi:hypothetical protein